MKYLFFVIVIAIFTAVSPNQNSEPNELMVDIFYESFCPDSRDFINEQLHPTFFKVKDYLKLNLVPFGKANILENGFTCQHGPKECRGNTIHNCVLNRLQGNSIAQVDYVDCAMSNLESPEHMENECIQKVGLKVEDIMEKCYKSQEGYMLMIMATITTKIIIKTPSFVPTIVFNNKYNEEDSRAAFNNFEATICEKLTARGCIDVCSNGKIIDQTAN